MGPEASATHASSHSVPCAKSPSITRGVPALDCSFMRCDAYAAHLGQRGLRTRWAVGTARPWAAGAQPLLYEELWRAGWGVVYTV